MSIKTIQTQIFISEFSKLKAKEIEDCKSKIKQLENLMDKNPSQKALSIKYQNYLLRFNLLKDINRELNDINLSMAF